MILTLRPIIQIVAGPLRKSLSGSLATLLSLEKVVHLQKGLGGGLETPKSLRKWSVTASRLKVSGTVTRKA
jgi:hypothetical protein